MDAISVRLFRGYDSDEAYETGVGSVRENDFQELCDQYPEYSIGNVNQVLIPFYEKPELFDELDSVEICAIIELALSVLSRLNPIEHAVRIAFERAYFDYADRLAVEDRNRLLRIIQYSMVD